MTLLSGNNHVVKNFLAEIPEEEIERSGYWTSDEKEFLRFLLLQAPSGLKLWVSYSGNPAVQPESLFQQPPSRPGASLGGSPALPGPEQNQVSYIHHLMKCFQS